jgi:hypothetical protein
VYPEVRSTLITGLMRRGKNRFRAARSPERQGIGRWVSLHWFGRSGQEKRDSDADLAFDFDVPTQAFREAIDLAEAETRATSHLLRCEERIERPYLYFFRHSGAVVVNDRAHHGAKGNVAYSRKM